MPGAMPSAAAAPGVMPGAFDNRDVALGTATRFLAAASNAVPTADAATLLKLALQMMQMQVPAGEAAVPFDRPDSARQEMSLAADPLQDEGAGRPPAHWSRLRDQMSIANHWSRRRAVSDDDAPPPSGFHPSLTKCPSQEKCANRKFHQWQMDWNTDSKVCAVCGVTMQDVDDRD
jgi:hypothetical protein